MATLVRFAAAALVLLGLIGAQDQVPLATTPPANIPLFGFGTWNLKISSSNTSAAVSAAIQAGYIHLDCAAIYGNEKDVGKGIEDGLQRSNLKREDLWITSKLWNDRHDPDQVEQALDQTLDDLRLDYLDLYLMHWPVAKSSGKNIIDYLDTWHRMEELLVTGKVRHIGVSNFSPGQLKDLISRSTIKPAVHQFETHPYLQQGAWIQWHKDNDIHVTAYSPLANLNPSYGSSGQSKDIPPSLLNNKEITEIAKQRGCTNAQVALKWGYKRGTSVIPKSSHPERIQENIESMNCVLQPEDHDIIAKLGQKYLKRFNNPSKSWDVPLYGGLEDA